MQYWARFEQFARDLTKTYSDVYVFSGPLYMPTRAAGGTWVVSYQVLRGEDGQGQVAVPTHFFKVILAERRGGVALGAFILPNKPIPPDIPLADFTVDLTVIERAHCPTLPSARPCIFSGTGRASGAGSAGLHFFERLRPAGSQGGRFAPAGLCSETQCILPPGWSPKPKAKL